MNIYGKDGSKKESALVMKSSGIVLQESREIHGTEYKDFAQSNKAIV